MAIRTKTISMLLLLVLLLVEVEVEVGLVHAELGGGILRLGRRWASLQD